MLEKLSYHTTSLLQTFVSVLRIVLMSRCFKSKTDINSENDLLILSNGPSLNNLIEKHESFMFDKTLLCVNFFPNTPYFEKYKPSILVISAPELWRTDAMPIYIEMRKQLFDSLVKKTHWSLTLCMPFSSKRFKTWENIVDLNTNIKIQYYNLTPIEGYSWFKHIAYRFQLGMPRPHNVLIPSIMLGMTFGFKKIFLWGADHSWLKEISVDENNNVLVNQKHFYDENTSKPEPMNKFKGTRRLHEVLIKFVYAFKGYFDIEEYAQKKGVEIYNATPNSFIDAFKRFKN